MNLVILLFFLLFSSLHGKIIETFHFREILNYVDQETLVILDIDDTLLLPQQTLGSDVWFRWHMQKMINEGMSQKEALAKAILDWEAVRKITKVKLVEPDTDKVVAEMQAKGIKIIGLTTQGLELSHCTTRQLKQINIDLSKTAPHDLQFYFTNIRGCLYRDGLLFTGGTHKGHALLSFFKHIDFHPKKFVFINDKESHLVEVEKELEPLGHTFIGLRYSNGDERVKNFNPDIAEYQWKHSTFDHILTDQEALEALYAQK